MRRWVVVMPVSVLVLAVMGIWRGFEGVPEEVAVVVEPRVAEQEKVTVADEHALACGNLTGEARRTYLKSTVVIVENEEKLVTGEQVVVWLIARDKDLRRTCIAGDMFEATAWSDDNRAPVTVYDMGLGVYKLTWTPVMPGTFEFKLFLFYSGWMGFKAWPNETEAILPYNTTSQKQPDEQRVDAFRRKPIEDWCHDSNSEFHFIRRPIPVRGQPVLPKTPCPQQWNTSMRGTWVKSSNTTCYPGLCEGDLRFMASDGWVYVPDTCYLRLYNKKSAWDCLAGKRIMWFGDSTLKQPATNLVENLLGVPVLKRSFNWIRKYCPVGTVLKSKRMKAKWKENHRNGCASPFDHRQWKITRANPENPSQKVYLRYVWGGGPNPPARPTVRPRGLELLTQPTQAGRTTKDVFYQGLSEGAEYVFLHAFAWDEEAMTDFTAFQASMNSVVKSVLDKNDKVQVHWDTGHPLCVSDVMWNHHELCVSAIINKLKHINSGHNSRLTTTSLNPHPRLTLTDRFTMAEPHAIGPNYCHFGIHFGAHPAFCHMWNPPDPPNCYRNWLVDKYELMIWMNKMCPLNVPLPTEQPGNVTIEDGVLTEPPEGSPTEEAM